jgi:dolichyl-phosphate-mannose-protein mannosyltransferase
MRVFGLIVVPVVIYVMSFQAHFAILNRSGTGDANMSSLFQAGLAGNDLSSSPIELAYGSLVTLKSNAYGGGLLHSHVQTFPSGSKQQQVTTYHHKDNNNLWMVVRHYKDGSFNYTEIAPEPVKNGDIIRLAHNATGRMLHSHRITAPVNKADYEVSGYAMIENEDPNDLWQVEIVKESRKGEPIVRALTTKFRLKHISTGCYLKARNNQLPEWAFKQGEVSCDHTPELDAKYLQWNVETHINDKRNFKPLISF